MALGMRCTSAAMCVTHSGSAPSPASVITLLPEREPRLALDDDAGWVARSYASC